MNTADSNTGFKVWGVDNMVYGPVELPTLIEWVKDERVTPNTWIYSETDEQWRKAPKVPEISLFFRQRTAAVSATEAASGSEAAQFTTGALRRVKIFSEFDDQQLTRFIAFMEVLRLQQWTEIVKQGDEGDDMFLILEGEVRVRLLIGGKETTLATLNAGEFFGEISLFDSGPRSADAVANRDVVLLKITAQSFEQVVHQAPDLAAPFLFAIGKTLTARIRADNKRYRDSVAFARTAGVAK